MSMKRRIERLEGQSERLQQRKPQCRWTDAELAQIAATLGVDYELVKSCTPKQPVQRTEAGYLALCNDLGIDPRLIIEFAESVKTDSPDLPVGKPIHRTEADWRAIAEAVGIPWEKVIGR